MYTRVLLNSQINYFFLK